MKKERGEDSRVLEGAFGEEVRHDSQHVGGKTCCVFCRLPPPLLASSPSLLALYLAVDNALTFLFLFNRLQHERLAEKQHSHAD